MDNEITKVGSIYFHWFSAVTQMQAHANFTYPIPEMDLLNALDDAALEQIIFAEKESDYEVYVDHPSNTVSIKLRKALNPFKSLASSI